MANFLDLLVRRTGDVTPRLRALKEERDLQDLNFQRGEVPDIELQNVDDLPVREAGIIDRLIDRGPMIEAGMAESGEEAGWYEVPLEKDFDVVLSVTATSEHRSGSFDRESFSAPSHDVPDFEQDSSRPLFAGDLEEAFKQRSREMGQSLFSQGRNAILDNIPDAGLNLDGRMVDMWNVLVTNTYGAGRDANAPGEAPVESLFGALGDTIGTAMESGFSEKASEIENAINSEVDLGMFAYNSTIRGAESDLSSQSESALNESPKLLYSSLGIPEGALMTPVQTRNADPDSFEFLGYEGGMTVNYTVVGS